ncbi:uncharacterized protein T551_01037 [Pneumocystis jirovecii RU7]|uniref:Transcription factor CBF/NF-Y/archaeal histone domain-containing protein n=1 Tax=Pneumocystis jirovecii (strain RU7) TaxID=1408657 RepID=A0A0W4ZTV6_PNEJ7|nr:uncharacterized protein T551_01037 [Pneumocystis jirovecii RU7]KTW31776.1 hypothetical protein T551_01037 [Pneumocystis jirovecii RU7]
MDQKDIDVKTYPPQTIAKIFSLAFADPATKISSSALTLCSEYIRIFCKEAIWRAATSKREYENKDENEQISLGVEDLERIAGQLTLDFS